MRLTTIASLAMMTAISSSVLAQGAGDVVHHEVKGNGGVVCNARNSFNKNYVSCLKIVPMEEEFIEGGHQIKSVEGKASLERIVPLSVKFYSPSVTVENATQPAASFLGLAPRTIDRHPDLVEPLAKIPTETLDALQKVEVSSFVLPGDTTVLVRGTKGEEVSVRLGAEAPSEEIVCEADARFFGINSMDSFDPYFKCTGAVTFEGKIHEQSQVLSLTLELKDATGRIHVIAIENPSTPIGWFTTPGPINYSDEPGLREIMASFPPPTEKYGDDFEMVAVRDIVFAKGTMLFQNKTVAGRRLLQLVHAVR